MSLPSCRRQRGSRGDRQGLRRRGRRGYGGSRSVMCPYGTLICHCHLPLAFNVKIKLYLVLGRINQCTFFQILILNTYTILGQTVSYMYVCTVCVLYCPLVSIPSNSSTTEYKLATAISSPVHVIRHLGPGSGSNVSSLSAAALASCPASSFMLSSCHASPVMDFAFSQTCTLRKDRHVVIHVEGKRVQAGLNLSKIQVF